ncbi:phosphoribosylanthranilate isomerase [Psychroserpens algicola]|uniref:N-(5'-phosphoribosyl)anthranilate isomerase n=1 Tax=Psychroserpens algicola TaxID=1719034 RepID=A0ABT0H7J8_9FLAO|nr:phosphoribosylanthranilate isomerase [Psychroserpens algicola]MCK8480177.1 phosphoribosylanthranilate isomerase [Psychroserpens algicola]
MKLKVCGMKTKDNILNVAKLNPDFMGFIFYKNSPRYFNSVIPELPEHIKKIGVFVDATYDYIKGIVQKHQLHGVQLHGNESPELCKQLQDLNCTVIKVFSIKDSFDFNTLEPYEDVCDFYLFDTKGKHPGGNGFTFDWTVLKNYSSIKPFFLSGGIGLNELNKLLSFLKRPEAVFCHSLDVNSKFETNLGLKNIEKLKEFKSLIQT